MSRRVAAAALLVMLCLLLSACAQTPLTQPPAYTKMRDSSVQVQDGEVVRVVLNTWELDGLQTQNYTLRQENGVRRCIVGGDGGSGKTGEVRYADFVPILEGVLRCAKEDRFGLPEGTSQMDLFYTANTDSWPNSFVLEHVKNSFYVLNYYIYSVSNGTLTVGNGIAAGKDALGRFEVSQYFRNEDGMVTVSVVYILIDE